MYQHGVHVYGEQRINAVTRLLYISVVFAAIMQKGLVADVILF